MATNPRPEAADDGPQDTDGSASPAFCLTCAALAALVIFVASKDGLVALVAAAITVFLTSRIDGFGRPPHELATHA